MASIRNTLATQNRQIIPERRGKRATKMACVLAIGSILFVWILGKGKYSGAQLIYRMAINFAISQGCCLVTCACELTEEIKHLHTRYNGHYWRALKASFNLSCAAFVTAILCYVFYEPKLMASLPLTIDITLTLLSWLFCWILGIQGPTPATISEITEIKQLNVAHGLAWSYYVGYLQFVLPALKESIQKFNEENHNLLKFPETCRLHILIPLSCRLYGDLKDVDENITFLKEIPPLYIDRAGIKGRVFKNNVYRILDEDGRPYNCIVEYATPLASLLKMTDIPSAAFSADDRLQQTKLFYRTLKDILENAHELQNTYRLIVYEDFPETKDHSRHLLSQEILKHIRQQHSEEYSML
ncbi:hypothetical protein XENTR_v10008032 [Xenopus tropicalis]|uniref:Stimulator of interferon genes protein n=2 Tax=Xenopus tropicalis TaxID=8364 RepID=A0A8J1J6F3_XENTR|nr:stimulator of interferon genes protein isoform X1 [Xenopus tropicalis]KAE8614192.1 hypothetical protein XENTR_v10008032 [Xenopus tropicalis]